MNEVLWLCYCVACSGYDMQTRGELYTMIKEAAENGNLDVCENTLVEVYGIIVPDADE